MLDSGPTTAENSPKMDTSEKVIREETIRYKRKGYGLITATFILVTYILVIPKVFGGIWVQFTSIFPEPGLITIFFLTWGLHLTIYSVSNLIMMCVYKSRLPFFERYKISSRPWPWDKDYAEWRKKLTMTLKNLAGFHFIVFPVAFGVDLFILKGFDLRVSTDTLPSSWEVFRHIIFFMIVEDFGFYWAHRLLHHPKLYPYIHKIHHEFIAPVSICAEYAHPIEGVLANMIPTGIGIKILGNRVHMVTYAMWLIVRLFETTDGHSGFEFSWSPFRLLPLSGSAKYHDFHHTHNIGNYESFFTIWDTLLGTNSAYYKFYAKKQKMEERLGKSINVNKAD